jgi:hypothetical protein
VPSCGASRTYCSAGRMCSDSIPACELRRPLQTWAPMSIASSRPGRVSRILGQPGWTWWRPAAVGVKKKSKQSGEPPYSSMKTKRAFESAAHGGTAKPHIRAAISRQYEDVVCAGRDDSVEFPVSWNVWLRQGPKIVEFLECHSVHYR